MNTIVCPACNHENESSRVFCHNCGVRLPRTEEQIEQEAKTNQEASEKARQVRQGKYKFKNRPALDWRELVAGTFVSLVNLGLMGVFLAAVILMFRAPADLPRPTAPNAAMAQAGDEQLLQAARPDYTGTLSATAPQISAYLAAKLSLKTKDLGFGFSEVERSFVVLGQQEFSFGLLYRVFGLPLVLQSSFRVTGQSGEFGLELAGGSIGRLPVHPLIFQKVIKWYEPVSQAMEPQLETLARAQSIEITPTQAEIRWEGEREDAAQEGPSLRPPGSGLRSFP